MGVGGVANRRLRRAPQAGLPEDPGAPADPWGALGDAFGDIRRRPRSDYNTFYQLL